MFPQREGGIRHPVYRRGDGPAVLLMHELPGLTKECGYLADQLVEAGFTVYLPLFFGTPGDDQPIRNYFRICIRREFRAFASNDSGPVTVWLRALCDHIQQERPGPMGAVGMCMTGGFVLSLIVGTEVVAPVTCQPALPIVFPIALPGLKPEIGVAPAELQQAADRVKREGLQVLGMRFEDEKICPRERFDSLRETFGRDAFIEPDEPIPGKRHGVLTGQLASETEPHHPTRKALAQTIRFLSDRLLADATRSDQNPVGA